MENNKKFEVAGTVSIISTGKTVQQKEEFEKAVDSIAVPDIGAGSSLTDMYDRFSHLIYVVDASGSMGDGMINEDYVNQFKWTPELVSTFRLAMTADPQLLEEENDAEVEFNEDDEPIEVGESKHIDVDAMTDDELKMMIVMHRLQDRYRIDLEFNYGRRTKSRSKMQALKDAARNFVHQRFQKFADARVALFQFEDSPQLLCAAGASEAEVMAAINRLPDFGGGGTRIYRAVEQALNNCKKRGSNVNLHHIVLVSDGCDNGGVNVRDLVPKMKELGVVFDFIYMVGASEDAEAGAVAQTMRDVCEATGGEYTVVKTEQDFEQKFLTVSNRPMLPPARS